MAGPDPTAADTGGAPGTDRDVADIPRYVGPVPRTRRASGVWPVIGAVLVVAGAGIALVPAVRAQAELSFTRQAPGFVELSAVTLDAESNVGTTCLPAAGGPGTTDVTFSMTSHLAARTELDVRVRVETARGRFGGTQRDLVRLAPEETKSRTAEVAVPLTGRYTIQVRLAATDQYLLLHCGGDR